MFNAPKISVIVPCYNVDNELIKKCIISIINQSFSDFEIIIVDDGSSQEYLEVFKEIKSWDSRIRILHKKNGGVSSARNVGVAYAKGEYVAFVDADDFVESIYLEQAFKIAVITDSDYVIGAIKLVVDENAFKKNVSKQDNLPIYTVYEANGINKIAPRMLVNPISFSNGGHVCRGPVARLIKKDIARKNEFIKGIVYGEDVIWNLCALKNCSRVAVVSSIWYYYLQHDQSAVHKYNENAVIGVRDELKMLYNIVDLNDNEMYLAFYSRLFSETRSLICRSFLTRSENKRSFIASFRIFMKIKKLEPWCTVEKKFAELGKSKEKIIYFLFVSNLYFPVFYIKDKIEILKNKGRLR